MTDSSGHRLKRLLWEMAVVHQPVGDGLHEPAGSAHVDQRSLRRVQGDAPEQPAVYPSTVPVPVRGPVSGEGELDVDSGIDIGQPTELLP